MELEEQQSHDLDQRIAGLVRRLVGDLQSRLNDQLEHSTDEIHQAVDEHLRHSVEDLRQNVGKHLRQGIDALREHLAQTSATVPENLEGSEELAALADSARAGSASGDADEGRASARLLAAVAAIDRAPTEAKKRQQQILDALIHESAHFSGRAAVFLARGDGFMGWNSRGFSDDGAKLRNHSIAAGSDPALGEILRGDACVGLTGEGCGRFATLLDVDAGVAGVLIPLVLRDKVAGVVYADRAEGGVLDVAALQLLVHISALAIESLPLRKREQTCTLQAPTVAVSERDDAGAKKPAAAEVVTAEAIVEEPPAATPADVVSEEPTGLLSPEDQPTTELEASSLPTAEVPEVAAQAVVPTEGGEGSSPVVLEPSADAAPTAPAPPQQESSVAPPPDDSLATMRWDQAQLQEQLKAERDKLAGGGTEEPAVAEPAITEPAATEPAALETSTVTQPPAPPSTDEGDETHPGSTAAAEAAAVEAAGVDAAAEVPAPPELAPEKPVPAAAESSASGDGARALVAPPEDIDGPGRAFAAGSVEDSELEAKKERARRLARLLVSEIKLYNEEQVEAGRSQGNIYAALKEDIDRSRQMYVERVDEQIRDSTDFFHEELVRMLAGGDAAVLGI